MVRIYAVIDTNVLLSALLSRFKNTSTVQLMQHLILGDITTGSTLAACATILVEQLGCKVSVATLAYVE